MVHVKLRILVQVSFRHLLSILSFRVTLKYLFQLSIHLFLHSCILWNSSRWKSLVDLHRNFERLLGRVEFLLVCFVYLTKVLEVHTFATDLFLLLDWICTIYILLIGNMDFRYLFVQRTQCFALLIEKLLKYRILVYFGRLFYFWCRIGNIALRYKFITVIFLAL